MKRFIFLFGIVIVMTLNSQAKYRDFLKEKSSGNFSVGTRNTFSYFNDIKGESAGKGIGGQIRLQFSNRINTEWYADYITSNIDQRAIRNDYHVGWSVMYYPGNEIFFEKLFQPYLLAGHCFDYTEVFEKNNKSNSSNRLSMATQFGLGTHINLTDRFNFSLSGQYMMHFGKEIETEFRGEDVLISRNNFSNADGHLLLTLSVNYRFAKLW